MNGQEMADSIVHKVWIHSKLITHDNDIQHFNNQLKGRDAILYHALIKTGVSVTFHHVLFTDPMHDSVEGIADEDEVLGDELRAILPRDARTIFWETEGYHPRMDEIMLGCNGRTPQSLGIVEVTESGTRFVRVDYPACGNAPDIGTGYGTVCMVATMKGLDVDKPWKRQMKRKMPWER